MLTLSPLSPVTPSVPAEPLHRPRFVLQEPGEPSVLSAELSDACNYNRELSETFLFDSCDADVWPWGLNSLHIDWYDRFALLELRESGDRASELIMSLCIQFSTDNDSQVEAKSPFWIAVQNRFEAECPTVYELVSECLDNIDHAAQTPETALLLFGMVQEEFCLSMEEVEQYFESIKVHRIILDHPAAVQASVKALEHDIGIHLPKKVLRFESLACPNRLQEVSLIILHTANATEWKVRQVSQVGESAGLNLSISVGDRSISIDEDCDRSSTLCSFKHREGSEWMHDFEYTHIVGSQTPYATIEVGEIAYSYLSDSLNLKELVKQYLEDLSARLNPFLSSIGLPSIVVDDVEILDAQHDLIFTCGDIRHAFRHILGKTIHGIALKENEDPLAKLTVTDDSVLVQPAIGFPYKLHYADGVEISQKEVLLEKHDLDYPEPLRREKDVWIYENCLHAIYVRLGEVVVFIDDVQNEKKWTESSPDVFAERMKVCPHITYFSGGAGLSLPELGDFVISSPRSAEQPTKAFMSVSEIIESYRQDTCGSEAQEERWKYVQGLAQQHERTYARPDIIITSHKAEKLPLLLSYPTHFVALSGGTGQLLEIRTEESDGQTVVTRTVVLPQFTQVSVRCNGYLQSVVTMQGGVERVLLTKEMREQEIQAEIAATLGLISQKYRCSYPEGWSGKWDVADKAAVHQIVLTYPDHSRRITEYGDSVKELLDFGDYEDHIHRCGNDTSRTRKEKQGNIQEVEYKRLPTEENDSFVEMKVNNQNELHLKTKYSKLWREGTYGYKAVKALDGTPCIAKLLIPEGIRVASDPSAKSALKMRAEAAIVVAIWMLHHDEKGKHVKYYLSEPVSEAYSCVHKTRGEFVYTLGSFVLADNFNPSLDAVCVPGIHYTVTQEEALAYHNLYHIKPKNVEGYEEAEKLLIKDKDIAALSQRYGDGKKIIKKIKKEQKKKKTREQRLSEVPEPSPLPSAVVEDEESSLFVESDSEEEKEEKSNRSDCESSPGELEHCDNDSSELGWSSGAVSSPLSELRKRR